MKNKESNNDDYGEMGFNMLDNQSVSQPAEFKPPSVTQKKVKKTKKNQFAAPINKKSANNFNINITMNDADNTVPMDINQDNYLAPESFVNNNIPIQIPLIPDTAVVIEYKHLKAAYKVIKQELEVNPNDEAKVKHKKKLKKRIKQLMTELKL